MLQAIKKSMALRAAKKFGSKITRNFLIFNRRKFEYNYNVLIKFLNSCKKPAMYYEQTTAGDDASTCKVSSSQLENKVVGLLQH